MDSGSQAFLSQRAHHPGWEQEGIFETIWKHTRRELAKMKQEPVKPEEASRDMANRIGAFGYMECSVKDQR